MDNNNIILSAFLHKSYFGTRAWLWIFRKAQKNLILNILSRWACLWKLCWSSANPCKCRGLAWVSWGLLQAVQFPCAKPGCKEEPSLNSFSVALTATEQGLSGSAWKLLVLHIVPTQVAVGCSSLERSVCNRAFEDRPGQCGLRWKSSADLKNRPTSASHQVVVENPGGESPVP